MWNILKTADCRGKWMNICDSWYYILHMVQFAKLPILAFSKCYCSRVFIQFQPNFTQPKHVILGNTGYYFCGDLPILKVYSTICYLSYIVITHKLSMIYDLANGQADRQGTLDFLFADSTRLCVARNGSCRKESFNILGRES